MIAVHEGVCQSKRGVPDAEWPAFSPRLRYVCQADAHEQLAKVLDDLEDELSGGAGGDAARLHYLSVPPGAAGEIVGLLGESGLAERSRVVLEKRFGTAPGRNS